MRGRAEVPTGGARGLPAPGGPRPAIRTDGLTRDFDGLRALDGLTLEVPRGSVFGFLGPNGAGKTTTMRLLLGLIPPSAGRAEVLGYDVVRRSDEVRRRCGVLLEHTGLAERLTAAENLDIHGRIWRLRAGKRRARIRALLEALGLWERRDERVATWSRGMRQRLAIARTLLHRPLVLFLDEPTAGLDPVAAADLRRDLLRLARREGVTVFLNTHNLLEAERFCDRVAVIRDGRLLSVGPPKALRERSAARRVRVRARGVSENVLDLLRDRADVVGVARRDGHLLVDVREREATASLVAFLVRLGVAVEEVVRVGNSLEDVFLSLVNGGDGRRGGGPGRAGTAADTGEAETREAETRGAEAPRSEDGSVRGAA